MVTVFWTLGADPTTPTDSEDGVYGKSIVMATAFRYLEAGAERIQ